MFVVEIDTVGWQAIVVGPRIVPFLLLSSLAYAFQVGILKR